MLLTCTQVGDGLTDFTPSPEESRAIIRAGYACPATLLVQFETDNFDETPEMQRILSERQVSTAGCSSSSDAAAAAAAGAAAGAAGAAAGAASSSAPASGYTSAWNSIDEDVSMDNLLQQLQELQSALQSQELQRQQQQQLGGGSAPELQQVLLPGTHVTPVGAQLVQGSFGPSPFDVVLSNTSGAGSQAELQVLGKKVLSFLDSRRPQAVQRRASMLPQQQPQPQQPVTAAVPGGEVGAASGEVGPTATETVAASAT